MLLEHVNDIKITSGIASALYFTLSLWNTVCILHLGLSPVWTCPLWLPWRVAQLWGWWCPVSGALRLSKAQGWGCSGNPHSPSVQLFFFFFLVAEPGTYGSSQARDRGIEPKPQLQPRLQLQLQQLGILNLPHKAGGSNLSLPSDLSCCSRILNPLHYSENFKFSCF